MTASSTTVLSHSQFTAVLKLYGSCWSLVPSMKPDPSGRKWKVFGISIVMGASCGMASNGPVVKHIRRNGWTGMSMPARRPSSPLHAPARTTTTPGEKVPGVVSTVTILLPLRLIAETSAPSTKDAPRCLACAANACVTYQGYHSRPWDSMWLPRHRSPRAMASGFLPVLA